jgi:nicotinamide-nucleotide amidase
MKAPRAELLMVGAEYVWNKQGEELSRFLLTELMRLGITVSTKTLVSDEEEPIRAALERSVSPLVIVIDGIGTGEADLTRKVLSQVTDRQLILREDPQGRGLLLPARVQLFHNPEGGWPGFWMAWPHRETRERWLLCLPGLRFGLRRIFAELVKPWLIERKLARTGGGLLFRFAFEEEEKVWHAVRELRPLFRDWRFTVLPHLCGPDLLACPSGRERVKDGEKDDITSLLKKRFEESLYATDGGSLEEAVGRSLTSRGWRVSVAESCTGGLITHRLTNIAGSSRYLDRSWVLYENRAKEQELGVPLEMLRIHGAVSAEVAEAMARRARERSGADLGLAVTGIAGPTGATAEKPVGLVHIALAHKEGVVHQRHRFSGEREEVKHQAAERGLDLVRRWAEGLTMIA